MQSCDCSTATQHIRINHTLCTEAGSSIGNTVGLVVSNMNLPAQIRQR